MFNIMFMRQKQHYSIEQHHTDRSAQSSNGSTARAKKMCLLADESLYKSTK